MIHDTKNIPRLWTHEGQGLQALISELPTGCEIHCFEPNPTIELDIDVLKSFAPNCESLVTHSTAIWDRDGFVTFSSIGGFPRGTMNGRGQSSSIIDVGQKSGIVSTNQVQCVSLLSFIRSLNLVVDDKLYIKLDVEGAEFAALTQLLDEGSDVLSRLQRLWVEWYDRYFEANSWEKTVGVSELTNRLQSCGVDVIRWQ